MDACFTHVCLNVPLALLFAHCAAVIPVFSDETFTQRRPDACENRAVALRRSPPYETAFGHTAAHTAADHWHSSGADRNVVRASATRRPSACAVHGQGKAAARRTSTLSTGATRAPDAARRAGDPGARVRLHSAPSTSSSFPRPWPRTPCLAPGP
jgi:hypothetical protein